MKTQILFVAVAAVAAVGGAVYQGRMCDRWTMEISEELKLFAQRLEGVPKQIGDWKSSELEVDQEQFKESKCNGVVSRVYTHSATGKSVSVYLVSGKAYHVTIHSPDWCYVAAGYTMKGKPINYAVKSANTTDDPDFLTALFFKETATETSRLRILWSYTDDGKWTAPKLAKQLFARKPALYKVYLISEVDESPVPLAEDLSVAFAKEFIPTVTKVLFAQESAASATAQTNTDSPQLAAN